MPSSIVRASSEVDLADAVGTMNVEDDQRILARAGRLDSRGSLIEPHSGSESIVISAKHR